MTTIEARQVVPVTAPDTAAPLDATAPPDTTAARWERVFHADLATDVTVEKRLFMKEAVILAIIGLLILLAGALR